MVSYGTAKAIPLQMPAPGLTRLLEPYGNFSPMGVLWYSIGASRPYEIFAGCAELLGGILLFVPRLALLGALVALAVSVQIFTLNMTYDVPVKLFSFHLILMSLVLIAPEVSRLLERARLQSPGGAVEAAAARSAAVARRRLRSPFSSRSGLSSSAWASTARAGPEDSTAAARRSRRSTASGTSSR